MNKKIDNFWIGLSFGLLLPIVSLLVVFLYRFTNYTLDEFFYFMQTMRIMSKMISLCVIPNLLLFFIFIWTNNDRSAKGVLGSTIIWAFIILIMKVAI